MEFAPKKSTIIEMELLEKGVSYYKRPDLAIGEDDVKVTAKQVEVTVHSLGSVDAPATFVALLDTKGKEVARAKVPALAAPNDLYPKTARVIIRAAAKKGYKVVVDPDDQLFEITRINNDRMIGQLSSVIQWLRGAVPGAFFENIGRISAVQLYLSVKRGYNERWRPVWIRHRIKIRGTEKWFV